MIDSHTHIFCEHFKDDVADVVASAIENGVTKMILPAIDSSSHDALFDITQRFDSCYPTIGLHPTSVGSNYKEELELVEQYYKRYSDSIVAIGEVGLDLYWSDEFFEQQKAAFEYQVQMSIRCNLPLIIHTRNAYDEMFEILLKYKSEPIRGVFHSYDQSIEVYEKMAIFEDFYFGIGGVVTFKKSDISKSIVDIPIERVILETDSPYLTPSPYRGKRNESAYLVYIAKKIAELKGIDTKTVEDITHKNAESLFRI